jgi:acyl-CoA synthetase (NDP forming)
MKNAHPLDTLFRPRSVAIVGATEKSTWTSGMLECMRAYGFKGPMYAVNRSGAAIFGMPGFASCSAISEPVDAAYISVPIDAVPDAIDDLARANIKAAVVLTSGYGEAGAEGVAKQKALVEQAAAKGIRLLGPNCLGFANVAHGSAITAIPPRGTVLGGGRVSFVCQSGATAAEILEFMQQQGVGVSFFAATGNEAQISSADIVDYLVDDEATRAIMVFAESIRNPARFAGAARRALAAAKPIVVLKVGASELAASVAKAHTGSLVGDDRVFSATCRQLGMIRVRSLEDLVITAALLAHTGPLREGGAGVTSISGGACTLIGDQAEAAGLTLPPFAPETVSALREVLPGYASTLNPLDITGGAVRDPSIFERTLAILARDPSVAVRLCVLNLPHIEGVNTPTPAMLAAVGRGLRTGDTPGLLSVQTIKPVTDVSRRLMREANIPAVTGGLDHAVRALGQAIWWSARQRQRRAPRALPPRATQPLAKSATSEREVLDYLSQFGVGVIPSKLARSADEAVAHARQFGGRVALKVASADIGHKTEVGGVKLRIEGDGAATAYREIEASVLRACPDARIDGVLVSPMRESGIELFVGTARDVDWGLVIAVGVGGIWVEALRDTAVRVLPVDRDEVIDMLESLRAVKILRGFRSAPAADLDAIADQVVRIGDAALALGPDLASLEINPLLVDGSRVEALDGLVVWS